jgi:hypothetical protein
MKAPEQVRVRFDQAAGLSAVCEALREYRVSYLLAGSNTVILDTHDFLRLEQLKLGALKDHKHHVEPAVPIHDLKPAAQAEAIRHRLMPKSRLLENIRARLASFR